MTALSFQEELLTVLTEIRNELRILRYAREATLRGTKQGSLATYKSADVEVNKYDRSIELQMK
jgi:hypothetical protein